MTLGLGIEPGTHWWEGRPLTTVRAIPAPSQIFFYDSALLFCRSVPLPKDVDHFKRERKLAINKSLQVCSNAW